MAIKQYSALTRSGNKCRGIPIHASQWCVAHHPEHQAQRLTGSKKGGRSGGRGRPRDRMTLVHRVADTMIHQLLEGQIEPSVAAVIIQAGHLKLRAVLADL